jgi:hypothetical protein
MSLSRVSTSSFSRISISRRVSNSVPNLPPNTDQRDARSVIYWNSTCLQEHTVQLLHPAPSHPLTSNLADNSLQSSIPLPPNQNIQLHINNPIDQRKAWGLQLFRGYNTSKPLHEYNTAQHAHEQKKLHPRSHGLCNIHVNTAWWLAAYLAHGICGSSEGPGSSEPSHRKAQHLRYSIGRNLPLDGPSCYRRDVYRVGSVCIRRTCKNHHLGSVMGSTRHVRHVRRSTPGARGTGVCGVASWNGDCRRKGDEGGRYGASWGKCFRYRRRSGAGEFETLWVRVTGVLV